MAIQLGSGDNKFPNKKYPKNDGNNYVDGNDGKDTLYGGLGNDTLIGGFGKDSLLGESGNDSLKGGPNDDYLNGGSDNDKLDGGQDNDTLIGGSGSDKLQGGEQGDSLVGGSGNDELKGQKGKDIIYGGDGQDKLFGGTGNDTLYGGSGNDTLAATSFEDKEKKLGQDIWDGGAGADQFNIGRFDGPGYATIINYSYAQGDRINNLIANQYQLSQNGSNVDISNSSGNPLAQVQGKTIAEVKGIKFHTGQHNTNEDAGTSFINTVSSSGVTSLTVKSVKSALGIPVSPSGDRVEYALDSRYNGLLQNEPKFDTLSITLEDAEGITYTITKKVRIQGLNDAPTANPDSFSVDENTTDNPLDVLPNDTDPDNNDTKQLHSVNSDSAVISGDQIIYDPSKFDYLGEGQPDSDSFSYTMRDSAGATSTTTVTVTINGQNDAPTVENPISAQTTDEDQFFSFTLPSNTFKDVDQGDTLTYSAKLSNGDSLPSWLDFDENTLTFSGTPTNDDVATTNITVTATDSLGEPVSTSFNLTVNNVNDAPTLENPIPDQMATEDQPFSYTFPSNTFDDVDIKHGDKLTYSATLADGSPLPSWLIFDSNTGTFSGTPTDSDVATLGIKVIATDTKDAKADDTFILTVKEVNDPPIPEGDKTLRFDEDNTIPLDIPTPTDPENNSLTITVKAIPDPIKGEIQRPNGSRVEVGDNLSITELTGLKFVPVANANGSAGAFSYSVSDGVNQAVSSTVTLEIDPVNDAPFVDTPIPDQKAFEGDPFDFIIPDGSFDDVDIKDGDSLTYSVTLSDGNPLPSWLTFDFNTLTFSGTPTNDDIGQLEVKVTATDQAGASVSDKFLLEVHPTNNAPYVNKPITDQPIDEGQTLSYTLPSDTFKDDDVGDTLTYQATLADGDTDDDLPSWLTFDSDTLTFSGTPKDSDVGILNITVIATDQGGKSAQDTFELTVNNVENSPEFSPPSFSFTVPEVSLVGTVVGTLTATDKDNDPLTYSISQNIDPDGDGINAYRIEGNKLVVNDSNDLDFETNPIQKITVKVSDGQLTDTAHITINLTNVTTLPPVMNDQAFFFDENQPNGTVVGTLVASDPDTFPLPLSYQINTNIDSDGDGNDAYRIEGNQLILNDTDDVDYENQPFQTIFVKAFDGEKYSDPATVGIIINDTNNDPNPDDPSSPDFPDQSFTIAEHRPNGTVIGTLNATDPDGDSLTFNITQNIDIDGDGINAFRIDGNQLIVNDQDDLDYETNPNLSITTEVNDGQLSDGSIISINLTDIEEQPPKNGLIITVNGTDLNYQNTDLISYDKNQDLTGNTEFSNNNNFDLTGNNWKVLDLAYTITSDSTLTFEFKSDKQGEIQGLGLDQNTQLDRQFFQLYGTQNYGIRDFTYTDIGNWQSFTINLSDYYTIGQGKNYLMFANDDDSQSASNSQFRNIKLSETSTNSTDELSIAVNTNRKIYQEKAIISYGGTQQDITGILNFSDNTTLELNGNNWKALDLPYTITSDSTLTFEFKSDKQGEIQGLGLEKDTQIGQQFFQLYGTQNYGIRDFTYTDIGNWQSFTINLSDYYTIGQGKNYLMFANDDDSQSASNSQFRNIQLYEANQIVDSNGDDTLTGTSSIDHFRFDDLIGTDTVVDFNPSQGDKIEIDTSVYGLGTGDVSQVSLNDANNLLSYNGYDLATLQNITNSEFDASRDVLFI